MQRFGEFVVRFWLICLALIIVGCTPTPTPTLRGPIVPTRVIPTATDTLALSATPSPTTLPPTAENTAAPPPTETPAATIEVALLPTDTTAPSLTPTAEPSTTPSPIPPTETLQPPTATVTNTVETPSPTVTNTVETPTPTATNTVETPTATPTATPTDTPTPTATPTPTDLPSPTVAPGFEPVLYNAATSLQPIMVQGELTLDTPVNGTIDNDHFAVVYTFQATAGTVVDARLSMLSGDLDPFMLILDPKGREIARNDDLDSEQRDSAIHIATLAETGAYAIVATRFGQQFGESSGDFELIVGVSTRDAVGSFSAPTGYETNITGTLDDTTPEAIYTFRATQGDVISIQMTTTDGDLDPNITLTDNIGTVLVHNDDNLLLGVFDSAIQGYIIPRSGYYAIVARRYSATENSGSYRLKIARDGQNIASQFALLNVINSGIVSEEGTIFSTFSIGDEIDDEDRREHSYQGLITFRLPPANAPTIANATFAIAPCYERGGGWDTLGTLTIYADNYGDIDLTRNITRPLPGARILATQTECAPLDLTALVQNAYATGDLDVQLRLIFRDHTNNGNTDAILITPSLLITFDQ